MPVVAVGDWHEFSDGYAFRETLFGPLVQRECVDCGGVCFSIPSCDEPQCQGCCMRKHGVVPSVRGKRLTAE